MGFDEKGNTIDPADQCRRLASRASFGALATVARQPAGHPFASLVAVAFDDRGQPILLLSSLAEHGQNLSSDPRASLLVSDTTGLVSDTTGGSVDPLAGARMTLVGTCATIPAHEIEAARRVFLGRHPEAATYATFADFAMWRLDVASVRWIGGFGRMQWVTGDAYVRPSR